MMRAVVVNLLTFKIPYYSIYALTKVCGKNVEKFGINYHLRILKALRFYPMET